MKNANRQALGRLCLAVWLRLSGGLVGCGGDGNEPGAAVTLDLSAANSDTVAHATATGFWLSARRSWCRWAQTGGH